MVYDSAASAMQAMFQYRNAYTMAQHKLALGAKVYLVTIDDCLKDLSGSAGPSANP